MGFESLLDKFTEMKNVLRYARISYGVVLVKRTLIKQQWEQTLEHYFTIMVKEFELLKQKKREMSPIQKVQLYVVEQHMDMLKTHVKNKTAHFLEERLPRMIEEWEAGESWVSICSEYLELLDLKKGKSDNFSPS